jgi:hypothetical protein
MEPLAAVHTFNLVTILLCCSTEFFTFGAHIFTGTELTASGSSSVFYSGSGFLDFFLQKRQTDYRVFSGFTFLMNY